MYVFEYLVYHLKPYGINTKLIVPFNQSSSIATGGKSAALTKQSAKDNPVISPNSDKSNDLVTETQSQTKEVISEKDSEKDRKRDSKLIRQIDDSRKKNEVISEAWNSEERNNAEGSKNEKVPEGKYMHEQKAHYPAKTYQNSKLKSFYHDDKRQQSFHHGDRLRL